MALEQAALESRRVEDPQGAPAASLLAIASELAKQGRLDESVVQYRRVLSEDATHKEALVALSMLAVQRGDLLGARDHLARASAAHPDDAPLQVAYGRLLRKTGELQGALAAFHRAVRLAPALIDAWVSLAVAARAAGDLDTAEACYRKALELDPGHVAVMIHCGQVLVDQDRTAPAEVMFRRAIRHAPNAAEAHAGLGRMLAVSGRVAEGIAALRRAVVLDPAFVEGRLALGEQLRRAGLLAEAQREIETVLARAPGNAEALLVMAEIFRGRRRPDDAARYYRRCLAVEPNRVTALAQLSIIARLQGAIGEADELVTRALAIDPQHPVALFSAADGLVSLGLGEEAAKVFEQLMRLEPVEEFMAQHAVFSGNYRSAQSPESARRSHQAFVEKYFRAQPGAHRRTPRTEGPLRVGYLSSDLRLHSVAYFLESVFEHGNRQRFEIHAYHNSPAEDEVSDRLRRFVAGWTPCHGMTDEVLAERIRADRIDILVDLNGHTGGSRLPVLAYKPAPVQVSWLGYPTTTGLKAVDYRITDGHVDPPGSEASSVERLARLPRSYFCYRPPDPSPGLSSLPAERRGHVTFGSFNNLAKVTTETLRLWARVLAAVPRSHFYFKARATHDRWARQRIRTRFEAAGFDLARVELHGWSVEDHRHLELYGQLDISLDTFPYNGATTTCEALWMGVPVVTLAGSTHASRMGMSILKAAGEDHLIAYTADEFVEKAATLASRLPELAQWRQTARTKLRASALLDGPRFARGLETAFEAMWQAWLAEGAPDA